MRTMRTLANFEILALNKTHLKRNKMNHDFMTFSSIYISHMMSMPSPGLLLGWAATEHIKANAYCFCYILCDMSKVYL